MYLTSIQHAINKLKSIMADSNRQPSQDDHSTPVVPEAVLEVNLIVFR